MTDARPDLLRALGVLAERPADGHAAIADALGLDGAPDGALYTQVFVFHLYPYASVYLGDAGMVGGEVRDRVAGFHRALGADAPAEADHLAAMLGAYAALVERDVEAGESPGSRTWRRARATFLWEHLLTWLPVYLPAVATTAPPPYAGWARLLAAVLDREAANVASPLAAAPLHLRDVAPLPDPRCDEAEAFLAGLLTPARAGFVLTGIDLARGAADLGLGLRMGERRYVLKSLFGQDAPAVLRWLADHADAAAASWAGREVPLPGIEPFWRGRARHAADLLRDLAGDTPSDLPTPAAS